MDTEDWDVLALTGTTTDWICASGYNVTAARGTNKPATTKTATTPTVNVTTLPTSEVRHAGSFSYISSRISRKSRRGSGGMRRFLEAGAGQRSLWAEAVDLKTGMPSDSASRLTFARRVTNPKCAPNESAWRCKTFKSSSRRVTFSYLGHTSRMRGVLAHESLSRTEMRSS